MSLKELAPRYFPEDVDFELDRVYKQLSMNTHLFALQSILEMGVKFTLDKIEAALEKKYQDDIAELKRQLEASRARCETLLAEITAKEQLENEIAAQKIAVAQTMGMGRVFQP